MAEGTRQEAQQRRSEGPQRPRSMHTEPFERLSDAAGGGEDSPKIEVRETMKRAALTAAVAAAVGAAGGVAKTLLDRRNEGGDDKARDAESEPEGRMEDSDDEPEGRAAAFDEEEGDEPEGRAEPVDDEEDDEPEGRAEVA